MFRSVSDSKDIPNKYKIPSNSEVGAFLKKLEGCMCQKKNIEQENRKKEEKMEKSFRVSRFFNFVMESFIRSHQ